MRRRAFLALALLALVAAPLGLSAQAASGEVVVFLVRHTERAEDGTNDPPISEAGWDRARIIGGLASEMRLTHIHSTDFKRTRSTAQPAEEATGLTVSIYDPRDLPAFAARLKATPGRHLVVGHSNTTPDLVTALGGDAVSPIEEMEYDRGYVVVVLPGGSIGSEIFRFGGPAR